MPVDTSYSGRAPENTPEVANRQRRRALRALGLVHSETSDGCPAPQGFQRIQIDPKAARLRRMKHATINGARLIDEQLRRGGFRVYPIMVTLTYARLNGWSRRHITAFLQHVRDWFRARGLPFHYCWVAELQKRGAVHFHVLIWMPRGYRLPMADRAGWWTHGMTKTEGARNPVGYMAKYVSKESLAADFPKGLRLHGRGGLGPAERIEARWWVMPGWVRTWTGDICDVRKIAGGGVLCVATGEWRASPWFVYFEGGHIFIELRLPP